MSTIIYAIVWLAFLASGFFGWFFYNKSKHEERKMLIQQGINLEDIQKSSRKFRFPWLKVGIVLIGLGVGFLIIVMLINFNIAGHSDALYPAIFCLCGGLALIIAHFVGNDKNQ